MATADGMPTPALPEPSPTDDDARRETLVESAAAGTFLLAAVTLAVWVADSPDLRLVGCLGLICAHLELDA